MSTLLYVGSWLTGWTFLGLKLAGAITWPWLVVSIPFICAGGWTLFVLVVFLLGMIGIAIGTTAAASRQQDEFIRKFSGRGYGPRRL